MEAGIGQTSSSGATAIATTAVLLLFLFGSPVLPPLVAAPEGEQRVGEQTPDYVADLDAVRATWPGPPIETIEDAFRVNVVVGDLTIVADTHLFGSPLNVIPYHNNDHVTDAAGDGVARGDEELARYFPPGEIGFAIKHHRPKRRTFAVGARSTAALKNQLGLQDTHIEIVVGVMRDGKPGVITLNSPQTYERGRFGGAGYPMIFVEPVYPTYLTTEQQRAFRDNVRTMMLGFNAVSQFPVAFNGGDPLAARTPELVRQHTAMMIRAIAGDAEALRWFAEEQHLLYCGELASLAASAGLIVPLNAAHAEPLVGPGIWAEFARQLEAHNGGNTNNFVELNQNPYADLVRLTLAPEDLEPVASYAPSEARDEAEGLLAFRPMTLVDMVELFFRTHFPREQLGESLGAAQGEFLQAIRPGLFELFGLQLLPEDDPLWAASEDLLARIVEVVSTPHGSYSAFRANLEPRLAEANTLFGPDAGTGEGWFVPPSLFHLTAQGLWPGGLLDLRYVGHGLHFSMVRKAAP